MNMTEMQVDSDGQVQRPCKGAEDEQTSAAIGEEQHGRAEADSRSPPLPVREDEPKRGLLLCNGQSRAP